MSRSIRRVEQAAAILGLDITILSMPDSTRTAEEAAAAYGCTLSQIVKSLIFLRIDTKKLALLLSPGDQKADLERAARTIGAPLKQANAQTIRDLTGFSIGGVSPLGHKISLPTFMDPALLRHETVWVAGGTSNAVFAINPSRLQQATKARLLER
ncbi:MAG: YbaK/EbsC family protein [Sneathiella sp.]